MTGLEVAFLRKIFVHNTEARVDTAHSGTWLTHLFFNPKFELVIFGSRCFRRVRHFPSVLVFWELHDTCTSNQQQHIKDGSEQIASIASNSHILTLV